MCKIASATVQKMQHLKKKLSTIFLIDLSGPLMITLLQLLFYALLNCQQLLITTTYQHIHLRYFKKHTIFSIVKSLKLYVR